MQSINLIFLISQASDYFQKQSSTACYLLWLVQGSSSPRCNILFYSDLLLVQKQIPEGVFKYTFNQFLGKYITLAEHFYSRSFIDSC